jgi:L-lactate utilization protein LutB
MKQPIRVYWEKRFESVKEALERNNFEVHLAQDTGEAHQTVMDKIVPALSPKTVSWGGSMTFVATNIYTSLCEQSQIEVLDTFDKKLAPEKMIDRRRQALLCDLFITGTNAVTEDGVLVNLDMIGNRVAGLTFGPRHVIVLVGRNKIVPDLNSAMDRVKEYAAPVNSMRLDKKTPCRETARCHDCQSPDRICNTWTITEKSFPKDRIKVVLINDDLGF